MAIASATRAANEARIRFVAVPPLWFWVMDARVLVARGFARVNVPGSVPDSS